MPRLKQYRGTPIVMILEQDAIKYSQSHQNSSTPFLYAIENFRALNTKEITKSPFVYANLPENIAQRYNQDYIFKVLVGKQRTAVMIFNQELEIVDIQLLPTTKK